jgi:hypothetical protein
LSSRSNPTLNVGRPVYVVIVPSPFVLTADIAVTIQTILMITLSGCTRYIPL